MWQETFVSALLRAILYSDDPTYWLDAYRKLDPITTPDGDIRFLQAAEKLFQKGANASLLALMVYLTIMQDGKSGLILRSKSRQLYRII
jgi:hypothetical protein